MKAFTITAALALLAAQVHGAPQAQNSEAGQFEATIIFHGADPDTSFIQSFPTDNSQVKITNPMSVTSISSVGGGFCVFKGVDGSTTVVADAGKEHPVNPPQAQILGSCQSL